MLIEKLYLDESFDEILLNFARRDFLSFDDFKQEVFTYLLENPSGDFKKTADKIAKRMSRKNAKEKAVSFTR
ncbi:MAG: hypothetical protein PQJ46_09365 [Spirochaetales bacterium]|nr:hypothetical protein [Spirochaetales bacterium]